MKNLLLILAGIACMSLTSCDDDDDDNNIEPTASRMEMITGTDWLMVSRVQTANGRSIDNVNELNVRSRDDVFRFMPTGEAVRDEGPTKEDNNPQIVETATWSFLNEEQALQVNFQSTPISDEIVELSRERLVLRDFDGVSETITTFQAE